jgi:hypothetical protein
MIAISTTLSSNENLNFFVRMQILLGFTSEKIWVHIIMAFMFSIKNLKTRNLKIEVILEVFQLLEVIFFLKREKIK